MKNKLSLYQISFFILLILLSCKKEKVRPAEIIVNPVTYQVTETFYSDQEWLYWHSLNDISHSFDEIYLWISDNTNSIPDFIGPKMEVWVKRDSTSNWEQASNTFPGGTFPPPFTYNLYKDRLVILLWYPWDLSLVGKKSEVKIRF